VRILTLISNPEWHREASIISRIEIMIARATEAIDTPEQADRQIASTINHELLHRGADVLPLDALEKYASQREADEGPWDRIKYRRAADTFKRLKTGEGQHIYTTALRKFIDPKQEKKRVPIVDKNRLDELAAADEVMREFFTPERQEQYQIRLPTRSAEPEEKGLGALFRRLMN
jgi:PIN domain nuclease of toxin-antitoxin system